MDNTSLLTVAMAEQCRRLIEQAEPRDASLPPALQLDHLLWMCSRIEDHAEDWPITRVHRWIGFVQCGLLANRILDLDGVKSMFRVDKAAYADVGDDRDLADHLNTENAFGLELGGES